MPAWLRRPVRKGDRPLGCVMLDVDGFVSLGNQSGGALGKVIVGMIEIVLRRFRPSFSLDLCVLV